MHSFLINLSRQRRYWAILVLIGITLEAAALYYQYALDEWPCVLCIHVRIAGPGIRTDRRSGTFLHCIHILDATISRAKHVDYGVAR